MYVDKYICMCMHIDVCFSHIQSNRQTKLSVGFALSTTVDGSVVDSLLFVLFIKLFGNVSGFCKVLS